MPQVSKRYFFMIDFTLYAYVILDFDGVVLDSNSLKKEAIYSTVQNYLSQKEAEQFVDYFVANNGLPRERKIATYFSDTYQYESVLDEYNRILDHKLRDAKFTQSFLFFLEKLKFYNHVPYILSGGDVNEIKSLLELRGLSDSFALVMGGPLSKSDNLNKLAFTGKILYIGDSKIDYEIAKQYDFDFVFMYGYTQFVAWKEYFKDKKEVMIIKNFETLTCCSC
jgi:phosphoglycolate phosphatase-like HAD superfamily hydrolase